jgi:Domain of unknown function (DUF4136)
MKIGICSGFVAATLLLTGAAWASVSVDYDLRVDFSRYKTYSWKHVQTVDRMWDQRVKEAIEGQLAATGLTQVPSGGDVLVSAIVVTRPERMSTGTFSGFPPDPWGGFSGFGGGFGRVTIRGKPFDVGTLVVEMFDGTSNVLVLRAVATKTISSKPQMNSKKLDSDVRKMFKTFPPGSNPRRPAVPTM